MATDVELMLETVQAERDALARQLQDRKRVRVVLQGGRRKGRDAQHAASGLRHAFAHALAVGHARDLHEHAPA